MIEMSQTENGYQEALPTASGKIMTVTGAIDPQAMGLTLVHEHVMSTFGAPSARYPIYDVDRLFASVLPYLEKLKGLGCQLIIENPQRAFAIQPRTIE